MKIMLIAGEASGDLYGGYLANKIKRIIPDVSLFGMGGLRMEKEGVEVLFPISYDVVGATGALFKLPKAFFLLKNLLKTIQERKPDKVVLIDFAEFNLFLLKSLSKMGIKTAWLFPPTAWAWRKNRAKIVKKADLILSTLPIERDFYEESGANVLFIGHPLLDIVKINKPISGAKPIVSFLPGSRECEIKRHLPVMAKVAKRLSNADIFLILAPSIKEEMLFKYTKGLNISIVPHSYDVMAGSDLIITSSGTATLESAILGIPMIVIYKMDRISFLLAKYLVKTKYISLPNIILQEKIIEEFIQDKASPFNITEEAISILNDSEKRERIKEGFCRVREAIGKEGAMERAANAIIKL